MLRDPDLLDRLAGFPTRSFNGEVYRATRQNLDPLAPSTSGGRWMPAGGAVQFLECDGLIAPSARWDCENLMLFPDNFESAAALELVSSEPVDWLRWAEDNGRLHDE